MKVETRLFGREGEFAALREMLGAPGGLALVAGEAGMGKSRLVREAAELASEQGRPVVWGRPEEVITPGPYALILDLVEGLAATRRGRGGGGGGGLPAAGRAGDGGGVAEEAHALASQILRPGEGTGEALPARRIAAEVRGLLANLGPRPVVALEDLHLADDASHAVLVHLARSAADDEHLLIGTYRPEEAWGDEPMGRFLAVVTREHLATSVHLRALGPEDAAALAAAVLGEGADPARVEEVVSRSEGVPFFIEELAAAGTVGVPESVARAVGARLASLDPVARTVVQAASLMPGAVDAPVLAEALELERSGVAPALVAAAEAGLLSDRAERLVFRHALVRDAVAGELMSVEREEINRRLADATERIHGTEPGPHARALAQYWYAARDREKALHWALAAGKRALRMAATDDARAAYELALACADDASRPPPEALRGLGEAARQEGRAADAEAAYRRAVDRFLAEGAPIDAVRVLQQVVWTQMMSSPDAAPLDIVDQGFEMLAGVEDAEAVRAGLLSQRAEILGSRLHRFDEAEELLRDVLETVRRRRDPSLSEVGMLESLATVRWTRGDLREAMEIGEEACRLALTSSLPGAIGRTLNNQAQRLRAAGRIQEGLNLLEEAQAHLERGFGWGGLAFVRTTEMDLRRALGQPAAVRSLGASLGSVWGALRMIAETLIGWACLHEGDQDRATRIGRALWEAVHADVLRSNRGEANRVSFSVSLVATYQIDLLFEGDPQAEIAADVGEVLAVQRMRLGGASPQDAAEAAASYARAALVGGTLGEAAEAILEGERVLSRTDLPLEKALLHEVRGLVEDARGTVDTAEQEFSRAATVLAEIGNQTDQARCLRRRAETIQRRDPSRKDEVVELLRAARGLAGEAGSVLEVGRTEQSLRALGVRPRAGRPRKGTTSPTGLSTRELEVASLVGAGASNAEIANRLFLSERTVQDHVAKAIRKLDLPGRAGLAAWAAKQGLV